MKKTLLVALGLAVLFASSPAGAATIVSYTFDGNTTSPASTAAGVTAGAFSSQDGSVSFDSGNPAAGRCVYDNGWKTGNYFTFTVTPDPGYRLVISGQLAFDNAKDNSLGSVWNAEYRVGTSGSFASAGSGAIDTAHSTFTAVNTGSLAGIGALQDVTQATTFHIAANTGSNDGKKWYLDNVVLTGDTQARASLSTAVTTAPVAKVLTGTSGVQYVLATTNNAPSGGTMAAETLNYTLGLSGATGLSFVTNSGSGIARDASNPNTITVDTTTSGAKSGTLTVTSTNAWQESLPTLSTVEVYQPADLAVTGGSTLSVTNAASDDEGQRAAARLASLTQTGGDIVLELSGLTAGPAGTGTVIAGGASEVGTLPANLLNGIYSATFETLFEHDDQTIAGTTANDLGTYSATVAATVTDNDGDQEATLPTGRELKGLSGKSKGNKKTVAKFLGGVMGNERTVKTKWRDALGGEGPGGMDLFSDVLTLDGTSSDTFVLQMGYDDGGAAILAWHNGSEWVDAVLGNTGGTPTSVGDTPYDLGSHFHLGYYGFDSASSTAWAVLNHNSEFSVTPEPATLALLGLGGLGVFLLRKRK